MTISEKSWKHYIEQLGKVDKKASELMLDFMDLNRDFDGLWNSRETRQAIIDYAYGLSTKYGEAAAELACEMYDSAGALEDIILPSAEPAATATYGEVAKTVNGTLKTGNEDIVAQAIGRLVRQAGADTTMKNAIRDGAEWAWVPSGGTCAFCTMLASRGWQHASKAVLQGGHVEHIHANCDCTFAIRHSGSTDYASYDPGRYKRIYDDAPGHNWQEKVRWMEYEQNEAHAEEVKARKHREYMERKERKEATQ